MPDQFICTAEGCGKKVTATKNGRYRSHKHPNGESCPNGSVEIPPRELEAGPLKEGSDPAVPEEGRDFIQCPDCRRKVKLTALGYYEDHNTTLRGPTRCLRAGTRKKYPPKPETVDLPLPGDDLPERGMAASHPKQGESDSGYALDQARQALKAAASTAPATATPTAEAAAPASEGASRQTDSPMVAPGPDEDEQWSEYMNSPESTHTPETSKPSGTPAPEATSSDAPAAPAFVASALRDPEQDRLAFARRIAGGVLQPFSPLLQPVDIPPEPVVISQPGEYEPVKAVKLDGEAALLATRVKETFYAYSNRKTTDNRSAQTTLGPSEVGTPCDRRLAMELMDVPYVNPGGDGWASFVGSCGHVGMGAIYEWANADTGRYAVEIPLTFGSVVVPRGTSDLLDRREGQIVDWKFMGAYSLKKFRNEGPSATYRIQGHVYGLGASLLGEKVRTVAIVGLPRAGSSLDEMHVHIEKYDKKVAQGAIERVERIHAQVQEVRRPDGLGDTPGAMATAQTFDVADDCRYCPFLLKGDKDMQRGCPGK